MHSTDLPGYVSVCSAPPPAASDELFLLLRTIPHCCALGPVLCAHSVSHLQLPLFSPAL